MQGYNAANSVERPGQKWLCWAGIVESQRDFFSGFVSERGLKMYLLY